MPTVGEEVDVDGHRLVVERLQGRRITRVRIDPIDLDADADAEPESADA